MAKYYVKSKLSDNIAKTPEGYLLCLGVPIARIGDQEYFENDFDESLGITPGDDGKIIIERPEEEVFAPKAMASFEGKSFTVYHPEKFVDPSNWKELTAGIASNIRRGADDTKDDLLADILITDQRAISLVLDGMREISCGYECDYIELGKGRGRQTNIVGNHVALVEEGRAGPKYAIQDHKGEPMTFLEKLQKLIESENKTPATPPATKTTDEATAGQGAPVEMKALDEMKSTMDAFMKKLDALLNKEPGGAEVSTGDEDSPAEGALEARLKNLEESVGKLMEMFSEEEAAETGDDAGGDSDLITDGDPEEEGGYTEDEESEEGKKAKLGDDKSRAEILCPGLKASGKNLRVEAIKGALKTKDGKSVISSLTGGKPVRFEDEGQVAMVFVAASELLKEKRSDALSRTRQVRDNAGAEFGSSKAMTPEAINEMNRKHYGQKH